jgi:hypothetical protein
VNDHFSFDEEVAEYLTSGAFATVLSESLSMLPSLVSIEIQEPCGFPGVLSAKARKFIDR